MADDNDNTVLDWMSPLFPTNVDPHYSLTIPKHIWTQIKTPLTHDMVVHFIEGEGLAYVGKLKIEKGGKLRVVGGGWKEFVEAKNLSMFDTCRFEVWDASAEEVVISVTRVAFGG
ncbi:hypothetical protein ACHQM5_024656 [Ranunculus cassubicifolius]